MARYRPPSPPDAGGTPALIRWSAVVGGAVIALAVLVLLSLLWSALAFGTRVGLIQANVVVLVAASAAVAMFAGGFLAGWLAGVPGFTPGFVNGIAVWGLILLASVALGAPETLQTLRMPVSADALAEIMPGGDVLWAVFWAYLVGAVAAGLAGGIGGAVTRPAFVSTSPFSVPHPGGAVRPEAPVSR